MPRFLTLLAPALVLAVAMAPACGKQEERFRANPVAAEDPEGQAIAKELADLASGAKAEDPEFSVRYDQAVRALTRRGATIEPRIIDTLRGSPDAAVRLGCVEVLQSIGSVACIEHLIAVIDDPDAIVALHANVVLRVFTGIDQVPAAGTPARNGMTPLPAKDPADREPKADERRWTTWHQANAAKLKEAWETWWAASKATFRIKE